MNIFIIGHKRHGKDTVAEIMLEEHGFSYQASSWVCAERFMFDLLKDEMGYESVMDAFLDRGKHRKRWFDEIHRFNQHDHARLSKLIFDTNDIYCGIRNRKEFEAAKRDIPNVFAIWVDASKRLPRESLESMELCESDADFVIDNNGSLEALKAQCRFLANRLREIDRDSVT